jgi:hypothetical protein
MTKMRAFAGVALLCLAMSACTPAGDPTAGPPPGAVSGAPDGTDECGAKEHARLIGKPLADPSVPEASPVVRHIRPGDSVTEDYRVERLNIYVTGDDVIEKINCG